ncbi:MAG: DUF3221 domain-containing protein, partial [Culicoidibacterales bacterium]
SIKNIIIAAVTFLIVGGGLILFAQNQAESNIQIRGLIQTLSQTPDGVSVLVETPDNMEVMEYDRAQVLITNDTPIWLEQTLIESAQLEAGMQVEISFTGAVAESYPVQATAKKVTIIQSDQLK